ncbi:MAG: hypothetical protein A2898_05295 [Candidatus Kerfeldbacteria bacterium RIFCSPLOWO2_01_FULL_48_11]|uniref:Uncharacterized protein n=1 Tax=Candidatus Kerfeldbacteria bacterium RIFCSPLOWO2_01_FULL_48_11 TaxID=1798543 RepID=A0A1G2AZQ3_9BACT|nr:MAG: hypothetical protein UY34_C0022G0035 [Parcubacteria group bacterium GW2011_GWA2_48_9]KKW16688.1 MAG: hypothetical protein UY52_C0001G0008 [Parcubacteria group bacterium GW2011_GWC2_49_9]OGY82421.1 MAG: hypothetical protein A2898_05295 [Candidatus Kerfeldbacteria bacterium RIFCSPLOWO2_01_FULL_48_11]HCJ52330.1 hypothetical protein [Candidatus Kerfeldbacteria bacterium]
MGERGEQFAGFGKSAREIAHMQKEAERIAREKREQRDALMHANQDEQEVRGVQREFGQFRDMTKGDLRTAARAKK